MRERAALGSLRYLATKLADFAGFMRSLLFTIPFIYTHTILMGLISFLISPFDRDARWQHACSRLWAKLILRTSFIRLRVRGLEQLDPKRTYVYVANHQSYLDTPVIFAALPRPFFIMAKGSVFHIPFLGWHLQRTGNLPVSRRNPMMAARRLLDTVPLIQQGRSLAVFPEGGRNPERNVGEFRSGVFLAAIQAGVPVVPITIRGSRRLLDRHSWHMRPGTVDVIIEPPVETQGLKKEQADELRDRVHAIISARFA